MGTADGSDTIITIPNGRGAFRVAAIESAVVYVPRSGIFVDEATQEACPCVLIIETRRCVNKFGMPSLEAARAIVRDTGLAMSGWQPAYLTGAEGKMVESATRCAEATP